MPAKSKEPKHVTKVSEGRDDDFIARHGAMFVARCSCGWESEPRSSEEKAQREVARHREEGS